MSEDNVREVTFRFDRNKLFDAMSSVKPDGPGRLGARLVATMLGDDSLTTAIGLAFYGVEVARFNATGEGE